MSHVMKIYKTLLCNPNVFKRIPIRNVSAVGVISVHLKTLIERNYQVVEKEEDNMHPRDLHEQEEDIFAGIFDDDEDDTIRVRLSK